MRWKRRQGLAQLGEAGVKSFVTPSFDGSKIPVAAMTVDRDGNLWVGSVGQGLFRILENVVEHYGRAEGLSDENVSHLFEDREGVLWVTTPSGIDSFRNPSVTAFSKVEGFGMDAAAGVLANKDGTIRVANGGSLEHIANGNISSIRQGHGFPGEQATSLLEDSLGNLWVGCVGSEVDSGTEVELRVPASAAYSSTWKSSWLSRKLAGKA